MARSRRSRKIAKTGTGARRKVVRPVSTEIVLPNRDGDVTVRRLTERILQRAEEVATSNVDAIVAIGRDMMTIRHRLEHGDWMAWIRNEVPFTPSAARNYIKLAIFAIEHPADFKRFRKLGPTKLYLLAALPEQRRRHFRTTKALPIPGTDRSKPIVLMTVAELNSSIRGLKAADPPRTPIGKVVQAYRHKVAGLTAATAELLKRADELPRDDAEQLYDEVLEVAVMLETRLDL